MEVKLNRGFTHGRVEPQQHINRCSSRAYLECKDLGLYIECEHDRSGLLNQIICGELLEYYLELLEKHKNNGDIKTT